jgi:hypothetical protein
VSGVENTIAQLLLSSPFDKPHSLQPFVKYIWGYLLGTSEELAEQGQLYPIMRWQSSIKSFSQPELGKYEMETDEKLTASLGQGITFQPDRFEVWQDGPEVRRNKDE